MLIYLVSVFLLILCLSDSSKEYAYWLLPNWQLNFSVDRDTAIAIVANTAIANVANKPYCPDLILSKTKEITAYDDEGNKFTKGIEKSLTFKQDGTVQYGVKKYKDYS